MLLHELDSLHRDAICAHLLALTPDDRASRFMAAVSDDFVRHYVGGIAYGRDRLIGALRQRTLLGLVHAAVELKDGDHVIEVGVSVHSGYRRQGLGRQLLAAAIESARRSNVPHVLARFRSDNRAMAALARSIGGVIEREGADSCAVIELDAGPEEPGRKIVALTQEPRRTLPCRCPTATARSGSTASWSTGATPRSTC